MAEGRVVAVLDKNAVMLSRAWCCFEMYLGISREYDLYAFCEEDGPGAAAYDMKAFGPVWEAVGKEVVRRRWSPDEPR